MKKLFLLSFLLSFSIPAFAEGVVSVGCGYFAVQLKSGASAPIVPTAEEACTNLKPGTYPYYSPTLDQSCGHVVGYCITDINHMNGDLVHFWFPYCPPNASGAATTFCTCDDGFVPDPAKTSCVPVEQCQLPNVVNPKTGKCGPKCTVDPIPDLPEPKDDKDYACTQSLDKGAGNDVDGACPPLKPINPKLTGPDGQMACLAKKLKSLSPPIPYYGPSSIIRTEAYQEHLLEIWKGSEKIKKLTPTEKLTCTARIADVNKQMKDHGIEHKPSNQKEAAPHVQGIAFDIPKSVAEALVKRATMTNIKPIFQANYPGCILCMHIPLVTGDVQDYINSSTVHPPACNLKWGGSFGDIVHFQFQSHAQFQIQLQ